MQSSGELARRPQFATLAEMLAARRGSDEGYRFVADDDAEETISFRELDRRARRLASLLRQRAEPGDRVLLMHPPGLEFLVGLFGCLYARMVAIPLYQPRLHRTDARLESAAVDSRAKLALAANDWTPTADQLAKSHPHLAVLEWIQTDAVLSASDQEWFDPLVDPQEPAILQYTSGSTGDPRGVMLTHRCVLHNVDGMQQILGMEAGRPGVSWLPAFHDMGLIGNILQGLYSDATLTMFSPASFAQNPVRWLKLITRHRAYVSGGPNFSFEHCCRRVSEAEIDGLDLSSWKVAYCGAEPISPKTLRQFAEKFSRAGFAWRSLLPCYGLAESSLMVAGTPWNREPVIRNFSAGSIALGIAEPVAKDAATENSREVVGCGPALPGHEIRIVDPQTSSSLPDGRIGEIWSRGPSVAAGYFGRPELSAELFDVLTSEETASNGSSAHVKRGFLRTGDLGFLDAGELFVLGRLKDLLIVRGRNIYPADVEQTALTIAASIGEGPAAAFMLDDAGDPSLVLAVECRRDPGEVKAQQVGSAIFSAVSHEYEVSCRTVLFARPASLPRTSSGKVRRIECSTLFQQGEIRHWRLVSAPAPIPPAVDPTLRTDFPQSFHDEKIAHWLQERIAIHRGVVVDQIDLDLPLSGWGLGSLEILSIASELEKLLGRRISPTVLYDASTLRKLAHRLAHGTESTSEIAVSPSPEGHGSAVVGLACRFPGAPNANDFWELLANGRSSVGDWPSGRPLDWPNQGQIPKGGYLREVDRFDPVLFGIAPTEAASIDPQHRLLLEIVWEAFEDAGIAPSDWAGRRVGVFVGISNNDYGRLLAGRSGPGSGRLATGNAGSMAAGRVAYLFDFRGPAIAVDTACSSSLVAVHLAQRSLEAGECELAVVAGVNLILSADVTAALMEAQFLSPTGRCHTFDGSADGYVRAEGCGVVLLRPKADAIAGGDRIRAVVRGSAVNQDGTSNGITAPNGAAQAALIRAAVADAGASIEQISYLEAHGTGTNLGDPIEFEAIKTALEPASRPCAVGAVKANVGHLEAAAGVAGLIKTILQLEHKQFVPNAALQTLNPLMQIEGSRFEFPREARDWAVAGGLRLAGVSSFGFSGTNAHVIVEEAPPTTVRAVPSSGLDLLTFSARNDASLAELNAAYRQALDATDPTRFAEAAHASNVCRMHLDRRVAVVAEDSAEAIFSLQKRFENQSTTSDSRNTATAFLFGGIGLGSHADRTLYDSFATFRTHLHRCAAAYDPVVGLSLIELLFDQSRHAQRNSDAHAWLPAQFALQFATAETLKSWGIAPRVAFGQGLGGFAAGAVAGVLALEDGIGLTAALGRAVDECCPVGSMLVVDADFASVVAILAARSIHAQITQTQGDSRIVLAGDCDNIALAQEAFHRRGWACRRVATTRLFHCDSIAPALDRWSKMLGEVALQPATLVLHGDLFGENEITRGIVPRWRTEALRESVRFDSLFTAMSRHSSSLVVELNSESSRMEPDGSSDSNTAVAWRSLWATGPNARRQLLECLGAAYEQGAAIRWNDVHSQSPRPHVPLPRYPYRREQYWLPTAKPVVVWEPTPSSKSVEEMRFVFAPRWTPRSDWSTAPLREGAKKDWSATAILEPARLSCAAFQARGGTKNLDELRADFDRFAGLAAVDTLVRLGVDWRVGLRLDPVNLPVELGAVDPYQRLVRRLLAITTEDGRLVASGDELEIVGDFDASAFGELRKQLLERHPGHRIEIELAMRCSDRRPEIIRGLCDSLEVLFPGGDASELEHLYKNSPVALFHNQLVRDAFAELVIRRPSDRPLRILEVGAGTGGTTAQLLPLLSGFDAEYLFTDVSRIFLDRATREYHDHRSLQTAFLDLETDPEGQGFADGWFDVVVAANVVHATKNLRTSIEHLHRLTAPGGAVLLLEASRPNRLLDMIFGLTNGWWRYEDVQLRPHYPLLEPAQWNALLVGAGFDYSESCPGPDGDQAVIFAKRDASPAVEPAVEQRIGQSVLLFADRTGVADVVAPRLSAMGYRVLRVERGERFHYGENAVEIDPRSARDYRLMMSRLAENEMRSMHRILHLWSLDDSNSAAAFQSMQNLFEAAAIQDFDVADRTWLAIGSTHGREAAAWSELSAAVAATSLGRTPAKAIWTDDSPAVAAQSILAEWTGSLGERIVAYRNGQRFEPRLSSIAGDAAKAQRLNGCWLTMGGNERQRVGAARWLHSCGAKQVVEVLSAEKSSSLTQRSEFLSRAAIPWSDRLEWRRLRLAIGVPIAGFVWIEDGAKSQAERASALDHVRDVSEGAQTRGLFYVDEDSPPIHREGSRASIFERSVVADVVETDTAGELKLRDLAPTERRARVESYLREQLSNVLGVSPADIDPRSSIASYGLDSLMAIQLKNRVTGRLGVSIPLAMLLKGPSLHDFIERVLEELAIGDQTAGPRDFVETMNSEVSTSTQPPKADVDQLSEIEVDRMLLELMSGVNEGILQ